MVGSSRLSAIAAKSSMSSRRWRKASIGMMTAVCSPFLSVTYCGFSVSGSSMTPLQLSSACTLLDNLVLLFGVVNRIQLFPDIFVGLPVGGFMTADGMKIRDLQRSVAIDTDVFSVRT